MMLSGSAVGPEARRHNAVSQAIGANQTGTLPFSITLYK
jgi:hypothetical protein